MSSTVNTPFAKATRACTRLRDGSGRITSQSEPFPIVTACAARVPELKEIMNSWSPSHRRPRMCLTTCITRYGGSTVHSTGSLLLQMEHVLDPLVSIHLARQSLCTNLLHAHGDGSSRLAGESVSSKQI